jgi:hypothetical protein
MSTTLRDSETAALKRSTKKHVAINKRNEKELQRLEKKILELKKNRGTHEVWLGKQKGNKNIPAKEVAQRKAAVDVYTKLINDTETSLKMLKASIRKSEDIINKRGKRASMKMFDKLLNIEEGNNRNSKVLEKLKEHESKII